MSSTTDQVPAAADPSSASDAAADAGNQIIIARQAILDEQRAVFGYELFDRSTAADAHTAASDAALLFNALSYAGTEALVGKKTVFINCTHESLAGGHLELIHPEKVVLEVPTLADDATLCMAATKCGCPPEKAIMPPKGPTIPGSIGRMERTGPICCGTLECQTAT